MPRIRTTSASVPIAGSSIGCAHRSGSTATRPRRRSIGSSARRIGPPSSTSPGQSSSSSARPCPAGLPEARRSSLQDVRHASRLRTADALADRARDAPATHPGGPAMPPTPASAHPGALPTLLEWLAGHAVEHDVHEHGETFTARQTARAEGVDPRTFAKVVAVRTDDQRTVLLVIDAADRIDLRKAREALLADDVRLLSEAELAVLAPEGEPGAMPAVGDLF